MKTLVISSFLTLILGTAFGQGMQHEFTTMRGRTQYYSGVVGSSSNLGYGIRSEQGGGWAWQFVDGHDNPYFHVQYPTGRVGIGTNDPSHMLTVRAEASGGSAQANIFNPANQAGAVAGIRFHTAAGWNVMLRTRQDAAWLELTDAGGGTVHTWNGGDYFATGKIAIGTTNISGNHRLYVNGSALAAEVVVKAPGSWPDYVFKNDYHLPSLSETEQYIKTNQHLPGVPTASEVKENGLSLGEMNAILLKKVEELTLHLIDQNKKLEAQQEQIRALQKKK